MTTSNAQNRAPLTLEDVLLLLVRRLLIPVALAEMLFGGFIGFLLVMSGTPIYAEGLALLLIPAAMVAIGLVFVGIPAGYAVARLRWGFKRSLVLLATIGCFAIELPAVLLAGTPTGLFGLFGAITAAIWARVNDDLFVTSRESA